MTVRVFRSVLLLFLWLEYSWELYLGYRQYNKLVNTPEVPNQLLQVVLEDTLESSRRYTLRCCQFKLVVQLVSTVVSSLVLSTSFLYVMWDFSNALNLVPSEMTTSCIWQLIISIIANLLEMPLVIYEATCLQEVACFNYQSFQAFLQDFASDFWRSQIFNAIISCLVILIVRSFTNYFGLSLFLAFGFISMSLIVSFSLDPVFDETYVLLPNCQLRKDILALVAQAHLPLDEIYMTSSAGPSRNNVSIHGFPTGRQSVVIADRLVRWRVSMKGCTDDEIVGILAHELGHWHHMHPLKKFCLNQIDMLLCLILFSMMFHDSDMYEVVGFKEEQPVVVGVLVFFGYVLKPYKLASNYVMNTVSRRFEFEADSFAEELGRAGDLSSALIQLHKNELRFPVHDHLYSAWYHTHPQLIERLEKLQNTNRVSRRSTLSNRLNVVS